MEYAHETQALKSVLYSYPDMARVELRTLNLDELNKLADALDELAVMVDAEAIRRIPKRTPAQ